MSYSQHPNESARVPGDHTTRRGILTTETASNAAVTASVGTAATPECPANDKYADPSETVLPRSNMNLDLGRTALVVTDPQVDFLSQTGVAWDLVGKSVTEHHTVENLGRLFAAAKTSGITVAISPHYYYPTDKGWKFEGALEKVMHRLEMFSRRSPYSIEGFEGSGADFMPQFKPYILDTKTIIASPHKIFGPQQNDLALQLRKNRIDQVVLAGMSANLCVESHLRDLIEQGFEVAVVRDATAAAVMQDGNGYLSALINFRFIANAVWTTAETVERLTRKS